MREKHLQKFVEQLEMAVNDIVEQSGGRNPRRPLPEEVMPAAMHFMTALLDGMTETDYARRRPEEALIPPPHPRLIGRRRV